MAQPGLVHHRAGAPAITAEMLRSVLQHRARTLGGVQCRHSADTATGEFEPDVLHVPPQCCHGHRVI